MFCISSEYKRPFNFFFSFPSNQKESEFRLSFHSRNHGRISIFMLNRDITERQERLCEMEDFEKLSVSEPLDGTVDIPSDEEEGKRTRINSASDKIVGFLRRFLAVQQRRALTYARWKRGFEDYVISGAELSYQQLCNEITGEFNDCSKQVREIESQFVSPGCCREDLAGLLRSVQDQEKQKLYLTATIQMLKKAGRPSERLVTHDKCRYTHSTGHECVHIQPITEASGTEEAEADAEYDNALKEAIKGVQDAVVAINEYMEEVRYEISGLENE